MLDEGGDDGFTSQSTFATEGETLTPLDTPETRSQQLAARQAVETERALRQHKASFPSSPSLPAADGLSVDGGHAWSVDDEASIRSGLGIPS